MSDNAFYLQCPKCAERIYLAKMSFDQIFNTSGDDAEFLADIYNWMHEHIMFCRIDVSVAGEVFKVVTEP